MLHQTCQLGKKLSKGVMRMPPVAVHSHHPSRPHLAFARAVGCHLALQRSKG